MNRYGRRYRWLAGFVVASVLGWSAAALGAPERRLVVFYTGAVHGTLEPCGCTSDPWGDIARYLGVVKRAQKQSDAVLVVDAGNLSYPVDEIAPGRRESADLRAAFLAGELAKLPFGGAGLGESDLSGGPDKVRPKRLAANLPAASFVEPAQIRQVGGVRVGIFGLVDTTVALPAGLRADDPVAAARREAERLRAGGAEIVIALAPLERPLARQVARTAAVDFVVLGKNVGAGLAQGERVGDATLVAPADELQQIGRIDIVLRGSGRPLADAGGPEAARRRRQEIDRLLADLDAQLSAWEKDRTADRAFVAGKRRERDELAAERTRVESASSGKASWVPPATGSYFTNQLIPLRRALPREETLAAAMRRLDKAVGAANLKNAKPPPAPQPGRAHFVGDLRCAPCHKPEMAFWKTTVHARAWRTLVVGGKTGHDDCVSCHVTGYGEVGGSSLGHTRRLESVQCESCHGPGSAHVATEGLEDPPAVRLATPEPTCVHCHNEKHSDTFQYAPYLRDILGPGHGEKARAKLGAGPTGHELRQAALGRAKAAGEALKKALH